MNHWDRFQKHFLRYEDLGLSIDISRMGFDDGFFPRMAPLCARALADMRELESGAVANPDENRMVGHYWLRMPELAPTPEMAAAIMQDIGDSLEFAVAVHTGEIAPPGGGKFTRLLVIGIGGSALGPQFTTHALVDEWRAP